MPNSQNLVLISAQFFYKCSGLVGYIAESGELGFMGFEGFSGEFMPAIIGE